jgi:non-specific protein-tyrosine kinase
LGIESPFGLIDYLLSERTMEECLVWPGIDKLSLLSGEKTVQDSSEMLSSPVMKTFVREVRNRYEDRFVFFDAPPVLAGADTMSLAQMVDGIILVAVTGKTSKENFKKAVDLLPRKKMIGVVMNQETVAEGGAYYKYY